MAAKLFFFLTLAVLCASHAGGSASAAPTSTDDLLRLCRSSGAGANAGFCRGYIQAMMDAISDNPELGCLPGADSIDQVRDAVVNYLTTYPEVRGFPAYVAVAHALSRTYSCKLVPQERTPSLSTP